MWALVLLLAAAAVFWYAPGKRAGLVTAPQAPRAPLTHARNRREISKHLANSNAVEGTHRLGLDGSSSFAQLGRATDDRLARVSGAHQRRHARSLARSSTAKKMEMLTPWVEPMLAAGQSRDWWS